MLVPLKEFLEKDDLQKEFELFRKVRNALCHGTFTFLDDGQFVCWSEGRQQKGKHKDEDKIVLSPQQIWDLSKRALDAYINKNQK